MAGVCVGLRPILLLRTYVPGAMRGLHRCKSRLAPSGISDSTRLCCDAGLGGARLAKDRSINQCPICTVVDEATSPDEVRPG